ncbi:hypothetical protein B0J12DRAFT_210948 [Macrophomina phaseolina]|uniref:Uncharacterized protein n=1 Tax=Macrophomina phaseolina TaxID=35725 RepID=A0ABQ8G1V0_9PEZI|nr:hypothetical protein B0J12DRAFT_210948 [Macrophomina phaseolina]
MALKRCEWCPAAQATGANDIFHNARTVQRHFEAYLKSSYPQETSGAQGARLMNDLHRHARLFNFEDINDTEYATRSRQERDPINRLIDHLKESDGDNDINMTEDEEEEDLATDADLRLFLRLSYWAEGVPRAKYASLRRILLEECDKRLPSLKTLARNFVDSYQAVYYNNDPQRLTACGVNIHNTLHIWQHVADFGPAQGFWQMPMEDYCGVIKPMGRSSVKKTVSLANAVLLREHLNALPFTSCGTFLLEEREVRPPQALMSVFYIALDDITDQQASLMRNLHAQLTQQLDEGVLRAYRRCQLPTFQIGSRRSQRAIEDNRNDARVCYTAGTATRHYGEVHYFVGLPTTPGAQWAFISRFDVIIDSARGNIRYIGAQERYAYIPVEAIVAPVGFVYRRWHGRPQQLIVGATDHL